MLPYLNTLLQWANTAGCAVTVNPMAYLFELTMLRSGKIQRVVDTFGTECTLRCTLTHTDWTGAAGHNNTGLLFASQENPSLTPFSPTASPVCECYCVCILGGYIKKLISPHLLSFTSKLMYPNSLCVCAHVFLQYHHHPHPLGVDLLSLRVPVKQKHTHRYTDTQKTQGMCSGKGE